MDDRVKVSFAAGIFDREAREAAIMDMLLDERRKAENVRTALATSTTMLEAMMVQLHSWEHEPTVNVRGQMARNNELLGVNQ